MTKMYLSIACLAIYAALQAENANAFAPRLAITKSARGLTTKISPPPTSLYSTTENEEDTFVGAVPMYSSVTDPGAIRLRDELLQLAEETSKGFKSSNAQKQRAKEIVNALSKYNPTTEPAAPYYESTATDTTLAPSLKGKWDLVYTDAPDITSLDTSWNPLATAKLGRIGQECNPPFIKNVIEWRKPDWADSLPLAGTKDARILQKVCTQASADPSNPMKVNLKLAGIELVAPPSNKSGTNDLQQDIEQEGLAVGLLRNNPLELKGPLTAPFGQFEVLYLDEEMRIIRTYQNYLAVNVRCKEEWF